MKPNNQCPNHAGSFPRPENNVVRRASRTVSTRSFALLVGCVALLLAPFVSESTAADKIWHIKAIHPEGRLLPVKAFDKQGHIYDVKAIEQQGNLHVMDVKALVNGKKLPVKVLVSDDKYAPVKAIMSDGTILDIKALTPDGKRLDVKGVSRSGNIFHIKAIGPDGAFYGVKAISPDGHVHDVKGITMSDKRVETTIHGVQVAAHIKALPQVAGAQ